MADCGARAAVLLDRMVRSGQPLAKHYRTLDYLTGLSSQCSFVDPCKTLYEDINRNDEVTLSFTPGFPMADFPECGMAVFGYGSDEINTRHAVDRLHGMVADAEKDFALDLHLPDAAVARAKSRGRARRHAGQSRRRRQRRHHRPAEVADPAAGAGRRARPADRR
jgi:microcystin degradation protein MlrC